MSENNLIKITFSNIVFIVLIFGLSCYVFSETLNELKEEQAATSAQEEAAETELELVESELSDLELEIAQLNESIITLELEIEELEEKITTLTQNISENQAKIEELTTEYESKKELLEKRLVASYKAGDTTYLDVLLNSSSISDMISNYYLISQVIEADNTLIDLVYEQKTTLEEKQIELETEKTELSEAKSEATKKKTSVSNMSVVKNSYIESLTEEQKELQEEISEYQKALKELENEIAVVSLDSVGSDYTGGSMRWPVPGYTTITSNFGMRTHPITGVYKLHTGIDISAPKGTNFIAAADGVVTTACYNTAYGNMVMIDHGGGVITLYAHGSSIEVSVGDQVKQGQTVLKVGKTGYATGYHAHFEVRVNGEYKNPLNYVSP